MPRLFSVLVVLLFVACLSACSSVAVPQIGAVVPCQIQSAAQVEVAIRASLEAQHWNIMSSSEHMIRAHKTFQQMEVNIAIAYGYRGFSIDYIDSQHMDYDPENDTIDSSYKKWAYHLMNTIQTTLDQQVKLSPPVKCLGKDTPA